MEIQNKKNRANKFFISVIILLVILTGVTYWYALKLKEKYNNTNNNYYTEAFSNLVNYINSVENYLAKAMISKSSEHAAECLTQVWRDSNLAIVYLSRIPLEGDGMSKTAKFLNQISDYSFSLSRKNISGQGLENSDFENLDMLYKYCQELEGMLNQLSEEIYDGTITWNTIKKDNLKFAQTVDSMNIFSDIDNNLNNFEGLIYDGAYSDHVSKTEKYGLTGYDINDSQAENIARNFFENVREVKLNSFNENADIPSYDFSVTQNGKDDIYSIMISKKGGHVVQSSLDREINEEKITIEEANSLGKTFLENRGFKNMKETYFVKLGGIATINYAFVEDDIVIYPDLIKIKVALDNGEILGMETNGYLNSHRERNFEAPKISIEEARSKLNEKLEIISEGKAIIPTEWKTEILCYEFKGRIEDKEFLVYINVDTGKEENILVILETPGGTLTA